MGHKDLDHWPPSAIAPMIAEMENDSLSPHWERAWDHICARARRLAHPDLGHRFGPDDLTQEVMIILMKPGKLAKFRGLPLAPVVSASGITPRRVFLRFLNVIIRRKFRDMLRGVKADTKYRLKAPPTSEGDALALEDPIDRLASGRPSVERQAEINEELDDVYRALRTLAAHNPSSARKVGELMRSVCAQEDYQRIAEQFERDSDSVRLDICRIRAKLRAAIEAETFPESGSPTPATAATTPTRGATPKKPRRRKAKGEQVLHLAQLALEQPLPPIAETAWASSSPIPDVIEAPENAHDGHLPGADARPSPEPAPVAKHRKGQSLS